MKAIVVLVIGVLASAAAVGAAVRSETVEYRQGDAVLEGYVAWDDAVAGKRPAVLVVHEWTGLGAYVKERVDQLAAMGYVAFGADVYGKGIRPKGPAEAGAEAGKYKGNRPLLRERVNAALDALRKNPLVDPKRIAAIGYCFGGTAVLELARSGAEVAGVVSFHGGLATPTPDDGRKIRAKVLVLHGADDPYVPAAEVAAFEDEMRKGNVDWQLVAYGGAVHSFTNRDAGTDPAKGAAYQEKADRRSWEAMKSFFREIFR